MRNQDTPWFMLPACNQNVWHCRGYHRQIYVDQNIFYDSNPLFSSQVCGTPVPVNMQMQIRLMS